jgi:hypothetical protein
MSTARKEAPKSCGIFTLRRNGRCAVDEARRRGVQSTANIKPQGRLAGRNSGEIAVECRENPMFEGITRYKVA